MNNPLKKIISIFIAIILLPVFFFIVYEVGSLNKNEEIIKEIYKNQLDAILYSVNQYSDDVVNSWANKVNMSVPDSTSGITDRRNIDQLLGQNPSIQTLFIADQITGEYKLFSIDSTLREDSAATRYLDIIRDKKEEVNKLITYQRGGFRKIQPIETEGLLVPLLFLLDESKGKKVGLIIIDPTQFVTSTLAPKMQAISQDKFIITAFRSVDHSMVYATDENFQEDEIFNNQTERAANSGNTNENLQLRDFWLLPEYYLGISMKEGTIDDLVQSRATVNLFLISVLILVLIFGIFLVYRNLKREIQLSQAKSEFVSNVSHEIRTPLSLISMFAETLSMNRVKTEEKKQEYYEIIGKETNRLSAIVNRILNFSQMEANKRRYEFNPLDLNSLVAEILHSYDFHLENKGFTYRLNTKQDLKNINADKEAVSEAVINLLDNAIKYSTEKKQIDIATGEEKGFAFVEVKDYGIGISRPHQKEVFDQFYRVPTGDIHTIKGSGLGLTLVKKIMEAHNGRVTLESSPGKGSAFRLFFPVI